jgi:purine nucleosidase
MRALDDTAIAENPTWELRSDAMRNFLIDTDTASDDAVAIMMALAHPDVRVIGLTTVAGNVGLEQATRNALLTAEICGADAPVFMGAGQPLTRALQDARQPLQDRRR